MKRLLHAGLACAIVTCCAGAVQAQMIYGGEFERALRPGAYIPWDGMPLSHRAFDPGSIIYLNGNAKHLWYLEYLDRLDRAEKNGYCPPRNPFCDYPSPMEPRVWVGFGHGFFRRR